jgi:hypothetical protein
MDIASITKYSFFYIKRQASVFYVFNMRALHERTTYLWKEILGTGNINCI